MTNLPAEMIESVGNTVLLVIQQDLGHSEFKTTQRYLQKLLTGRIRLSALRTWNEYLDGFKGDGAVEGTAMASDSLIAGE